ncbi:MAG: amino acid permease [Acidobacteriota bacterium]
MKSSSNINSGSGEAPKRFGTFEGVFTPSILTIIGVILFLRLGWVVGNVGFLGALLIISLAHIATVTTSLAMASMTTNVKIGDGGFYSLISRSLGLEVGGAIGISLYISQALSVALYIVGFTEVWLSIFPGHEPRLVSSVVLGLILLLSFISAKVVMKFQYLIMILITAALFSFFLGGGENYQLVLWRESSTASFWVIFAVFFPAVTGISAGAAMSGELKNPRKNIPLGILMAVGFGFVIYVFTAFWLNIHATPAELINNNLIMKDLAEWKWMIIAGIMGATISSALGSILGAPRVLMALGQDRAVPFSGLWERRSGNGEPRFALIFTAVIVEISILLGDLNSIAPLLTMFFLITYGMINLAVFIEKAVGITAFRPSLKVPKLVSLFGGLWCFTIMFLINFGFAVISFIIIAVFYFVQVKRGLDAPWGDIRSAMFNAISEWAAKASARMPQTARSWKPNLMIPIEDPKEWTCLMGFIKDIVFPKGTLRAFSVVTMDEGIKQKTTSVVNRFFRKKEVVSSDSGKLKKIKLEKELTELMIPVKKEGIFTASMVIEAPGFLDGLHIVTQVMKGMFFPPNLIFLTMSNDRDKDERLEHLIGMSIEEKLGLIVMGFHSRAAFGNKKQINLWIRDKSPNQNLATLLSLELHNSWENLRLIRVTSREEDLNAEMKDLERIKEEARLPAGLELVVIIGDFFDILDDPPKADINIFGISGGMGTDNMHRIVDQIKTSCMFAKDSGGEDAQL